MAYTPKTWACGETITADDLNHIENGIANAGGGGTPLVVNITDAPCPNDSSIDHQVLDKTWQEIYDAVSAGQLAVFIYADSDTTGGIVKVSPLIYIAYDTQDQAYELHLFNYTNLNDPMITYTTDNANGYPSTTCSAE